MLYDWNFLLYKNNLYFGTDNNGLTDRQTKLLVPNPLLLLQYKLINMIILFNKNFNLRSEIIFGSTKFAY